MKYALFLGCTIPARMKQYEASARAVLEKLDVELIDIRDFNCCGYPMRNYDSTSFLMSSARNIALARKAGLGIMTLCMCCYGSLMRARQALEDGAASVAIGGFLKKEKLPSEGPVEIKHILTLLHRDIGIEALKEKIIRPFSGVSIAAHYGCHALRPSDIVEFDDPENPVILEELIGATGAVPVSWQNRLECCGAPLMGINDGLSQSIMRKKIEDGRGSGAHYLCSSCPYCQIQFDSVQNSLAKEKGWPKALGSILYTQLLGLSMGIDGKDLQIGKNAIDITGVEKHLTMIK